MWQRKAFLAGTTLFSVPSHDLSTRCLPLVSPNHTHHMSKAKEDRYSHKQRHSHTLPFSSSHASRTSSESQRQPLPRPLLRVFLSSPHTKEPSGSTAAPESLSFDDRTRCLLLPLTTVRSSEARHNTGTPRPSGERQKTLATNFALRLESGCLRVTALFRRLTSPATGSLDSYWLVRLVLARETRRLGGDRATGTGEACLTLCEAVAR
jgi:hypothetical protein